MLAVLLADHSAASTGGPDAFGYQFIDSAEPGGPAYDFVDISTTGTLAATVSTGDDVGELVPIGFSFSHYGTPFTDCGISSNGFLSLGSPSNSLNIISIPSATPPDNVIAGFWHDLNPASGGNVYYQTIGSAPNRVFLVQFQDVQEYNFPSVLNTFQFKLFEGSSNIEIHYQSIGNASGIGLIGIENGSGSVGLEYFNGSGLPPIGSGPFAVRFSESPEVNATFGSAATVPVTAAGYSATGKTVNLSLAYAPTPGTTLKIIDNTGINFIDGAFDNLANGQPVALTYLGQTYPFVAWYYGGTGNDLVLLWKNTGLASWGRNNFGQIGDGTFSTTISKLVPVETDQGGIYSEKTLVQVVRGASHTVALYTDGTVAAWGSNQNGRIGINVSDNSRYTVPQLVDTTSGSALAGKFVVALAAGDYHTLALCSDGTVVGWGGNTQGQLGTNNFTDAIRPVAVNTTSGTSALFGKTVVAIAAGGQHSVALCSDNTLAGWGTNTLGEVGDNTFTRRTTPRAVVNTGALADKTIIAIEAGTNNSMALSSTGLVVTWGRSTTLGNNSGIESPVPVNVDTSGALSGKTVVSIKTGGGHCVALCSDDTLVAWGTNDNGQLGDNSVSYRPVPTLVNRASGTSSLFGKTIKSISTGWRHTFALATDGSVSSWGTNQWGQLGNNSTSQSNVPTLVNTTDGVSALFDRPVSGLSSSSSGAEHSIAIYVGAPGVQISAIANFSTNEDTSTGNVSFTVGTVGTLTATSSNTTLVPNGNIILGGSGSSRTINITPALDQNGNTTITINDSLSGGSRSFVLTVNPLNDAPRFTKGANQIDRSSDPGPRTIPGWATGISPGPPDEAGQGLTFVVTNSNNALFTSNPTIRTSTGNLEYQPNFVNLGTVTVTVQLRDNGSDINGNVNISAAQTFTITIIPSVDEPLTPASGSPNAGMRTQLSWNTLPTAGLTYELFLGTSPGSLASQGTVTSPYTPALDFGSTYYWRVDALFDGQRATGTVFSFTTRPKNIVVNTALDENDGFNTGGVSLREAVGEVITASPPETITFDGGLDGQSIDLVNGEVTIGSAADVSAAALPNGMTIDANDASRIFNVLSGVTATLDSLSLANGDATNNGSPIDGGAIRNAGTLTLNRCVLIDNRGSVGGAIYATSTSVLTLNDCTIDGSEGTSQAGSLFQNGGTITINRSTFSGNHTPNNGGAIYVSGGGSLYINNSTFSGNSSSSIGGGGAIVANFGSQVHLVNTTIANNTAPVGGGIFIVPGQAVILTLENTIVANNPSTNGVDIKGAVTSTSGINFIGDPAAASGLGTLNVDYLTGNAMLSPLGNFGGPTRTMPPLPGSPVIDPAGGATSSSLTTDQLGALRLADGSYPADGIATLDIGAVEVIPVQVVTSTADTDTDTGSLRQILANLPFGAGGRVLFDSSIDGGTIILTTFLALDDESVTIDASSLSDGMTIDLGGWTFSLGYGSVTLDSLTFTNGGTLLTLDDALVTFTHDGVVTLRNSTIKNCYRGIASYQGGTETLMIINSTITNCQDYGVTSYGGQAIIRNSTIVGNGGEGIWLDGGDLLLENTIVAGNAEGLDIFDYEFGSATVTDGGGNLIGDNTSVATVFPFDGVLVGNTANPVAPGLAQLGDYGGLTPTMPPLRLSGSPAIDAGVPTELTTDQRGFDRPVGAGVDIGAVEDESGDLFVYNQVGAVISGRGSADLTQIEISSDPNFDDTAGTLAGIPESAGSAGGARGAAQFSFPTGVAQDASGNVFIADTANHQVRMLSPSGQVTTIAGSGDFGFADGSGPGAEFAFPAAVAFGTNHNILYVSDTFNHRIRKLTRPSVAGQPWTVATLAGTGIAGFADGSGAVAQFNQPHGLAVAANGDVLVADSQNHRIRRVTPAGLVSTFAGSGVAGGSNGSGTAAEFNSPTGLAFDSSGNLFVADRDNHGIRMITPAPARMVDRFAGPAPTLATVELTDCHTFGINAAVCFGPNHPLIVPGIEISGPSLAPGTTVVAITHRDGFETDFTISPPKIADASGETWTFQRISSGYVDGNLAAARFNHPVALCFDDDDNLYIADEDNHAIRRIDKLTGTTSTVAGNGTPGYANGLGAAARFRCPSGLLVDGDGNLIIADTQNHVLRSIQVEPLTVAVSFDLATGILSGVIDATALGLSNETTYYYRLLRAGGGTAAGGTFYLHRLPVVRTTAATPVTSTGAQFNGRVNPNGSPTSVVFEYSTDPGMLGPWQVATPAVTGLMKPQGIVVVGNNTFVADEATNAIYKIDGNGSVSLFAGAANGDAGYVEGTGAAARFDHPAGIAADSMGNLYVADAYNHAVRKISPLGVVENFAGSGLAGFADGASLGARFLFPRGVAVKGNDVYVADTDNHRIRKISAGQVVPYAGTGVAGLADGAGGIAKFSSPHGLAINAAGLIHVADTGNGRLRLITAGGSVVTLAQVPSPVGVAVNNSTGNLYVTDRDHHRIHSVAPGGAVTTVAGSGTPGSGDSDPLQLYPATTTGFNLPTGIAINGDGSLIVSDSGNAKLRKVGRAEVPRASATTTPTGTAEVDVLGSTTLALKPGSIYYFRATAANERNPLDPVNGEILSFETLQSEIVVHAGATVSDPVVSSGQAIDIGELPVSATEAVTTFAIENIGSFDLAISNIAVAAPGGGFSGGASNVSVSTGAPYGFALSLQRITPGTFQATVTIASDDLDEGSIVFTVTGKVVAVPGLSNLAATEITATGVKFSANVDPKGSATELVFQYSLDPDFEGALEVFTSAGQVQGFANGCGAGASFDSPSGVAVDRFGNVYVADTGNNRIRRINVNGDCSVLAGTGAAAILNAPEGLATGVQGNIYVADTQNHRILKITPAGVISTVAGFGSSGAFTDGVVSGARFNAPSGVAVDAAGNLYVADTGNNRVRKISTAGEVSTMAMPAGLVPAGLNAPKGVAVDLAGNVFVADTGNNRVIDLSRDRVHTSGLSGPAGISVDALGRIFVADRANHRIARIDPDNAIVHVAGLSGTPGGTDDPARFNLPSGIAVSPAGTIYIADKGNHRIRQINLASRTAVAATGILSPGVVELTVAGLTPDKTYYYRAIATNGGGSTYSPAGAPYPTFTTLDNQAELANLTINGAAVDGFNPCVYSYPAVQAFQSTVVIVATANSANSQIQLFQNGAYCCDLESGVPSAPLPIAAGDTVFQLALVSADGTAAHAYTVPITLPLGPFGQWQQAEFGGDAGNAAIAGPLANTDHDDYNNLLEYAFHLDPGASSIAGGPTVARSGGFLTITYPRLISGTDLTYKVEWSTNLLNWSDVGVTEQLLPPQGSTLTDDILGKVPDPERRKFIRVTVSLF